MKFFKQQVNLKIKQQLKIEIRNDRIKCDIIIVYIIELFINQIQQINMEEPQMKEQQIQIHPQDGSNLDNQKINTMNVQLNGIFKKFMDDFQKTTKMHSYLSEIRIEPQQLLTSYKSIIESNNNLVVKSRTHQMIRQSAIKYFQFLLAFLKTKNTEDLDSKGRIVWYLQAQIKLHCCLQLIHIFNLQKDITNSPPEDYRHVWQKIKVQKANDVQKIKKDYKSMKKMLHIATSATINQSQHDFQITKKMSFGLSFTQYYIMNDSSKLRSFIFYRKPTIEMAQKIWNLPEMGATRQLSKITFEGIKTNLKIYIPANGQLKKGLNIFEPSNNSITVRVLYNKKLQKNPEFGQHGCCCQPSYEGKIIDKIIIHMHGGGFVALSSRSMQNYTRKWANQLGIPIFSIDYRMPPDHPFPQAPYDCLTVYRFILEHLHRYLNVKPTKIYLAGDSAGGSLACVLTGLILKHKLLIPRGLYLSYPATNLKFIFTPSRLYAITDPLLWPSMLVLCLNSYMNGDLSKCEDPLASPILLTEDYVNGANNGDRRFPLKWPKTVITVGNKDPLYDDSLMLMEKMVESNVDCECIVYDELSHGYLSTELFIKESEKTMVKSIEHLKKLIHQNDSS